MAQSFAQYQGDGSTKSFAVPFSYISKSNITVSVAGAQVGFTMTGANTLMLADAPAAGAIVEIRRNTKRDGRIVDFVDGSTLVENDLDQSATQLIYLAQEALDNAEAAPRYDATGAFNFQTRRARNALDPVDPQDLVTKKWAETSASSSVARAEAAAVRASAALPVRVDLRAYYQAGDKSYAEALKRAKVGAVAGTTFVFPYDAQVDPAVAALDGPFRYEVNRTLRAPGGTSYPSYLGDPGLGQLGFDPSREKGTRVYCEDSSSWHADNVLEDGTGNPAIRAYRGFWQGQAKNAYDVVAPGTSHSMFVGALGGSPSGSALSESAVTYVFGASNSGSGYSEFQGRATALKGAATGRIADGLNWWGDEMTVSGKDSPTQVGYDHFLWGRVTMVQRRVDGSNFPNGYDYRGTGCYIGGTRPGFLGFEPGRPGLGAPAAFTSDICYWGGGWAGPANAYDGYDANAQDGYGTVFKAGGVQGPWFDPGGHSRVGYGFASTDYRIGGFVAFTKHPNHDPAKCVSFGAAPDAGPAVFGLSSPLEQTTALQVGQLDAPTADATGINAVRWQPAAGKKRASQRFGDVWIFGKGVDNASDRFQLYSIPANKFTLDIDPASGDTLIRGGLAWQPQPAVTPADNGTLVVEATSNTQIKIKLKGSDGVVRSVTLTLA